MDVCVIYVDSVVFARGVLISPKIPPNILIRMRRFPQNPESGQHRLMQIPPLVPFSSFTKFAFILSCAQSSWRWSHPFVGLKRQINFPVSNVFTSSINKFFLVVSFGFFCHSNGTSWNSILFIFGEMSSSPVHTHFIHFCSIKWTQFSLKPIWEM